VLVPFVLLTRDFAQNSWYLGRGGLFRRVKPLLVRALGLVWGRVATTICCASSEEVRQSRVPPHKVVLLPWPYPDTPLARAAGEGAIERNPDGPVALLSRLDPWRKGFDRVAAWLERHADDLPRPAVLLLAPRDDSDSVLVRRFAELTEAGLVEWDTTSQGAALTERLQQCRGVLLLSRWEGQPRALREALLLGLPVLTTPSSHLTEVFASIGGGMDVDGDNPDDVQRGFLALQGLPASAERARDTFGNRRVGEFLIDVLRGAADGRPDRDPTGDYYAALQEVS